jgi:hypothetical protein
MSKQPTTYPDISDILARKAEARKERAKLSFVEKIAIIERLRERDAPFKKVREERRVREEQRRRDGSGSPD